MLNASSFTTWSILITCIFLLFYVFATFYFSGVPKKKSIKLALITALWGALMFWAVKSDLRGLTDGFAGWAALETLLGAAESVSMPPKLTLCTDPARSHRVRVLQRDGGGALRQLLARRRPTEVSGGQRSRPSPIDGAGSWRRRHTGTGARCPRDTSARTNDRPRARCTGHGIPSPHPRAR